MNAVEKNMYAHLLKLWKQFPVSVQERVYPSLKSTGIPYFLSYIAGYEKNHRLSNFAGNLLHVKEEYLRRSGNERKVLSDQFNAIVDGLVLKNGVKKTTYSMRHRRILSEVLGEKKFRIKKEELRVLDVPSSVGTSSLDNYEILSKDYKIGSYVLGDLYFKIYYDAERGCVYDEDGNLLQKKFKKRFIDIYRPLTSGESYNILAHCLLLPFNLMSWYFKKKYGCADTNLYHPIMLLHPDVEQRLKDGTFDIRKIDVFENINEQFDMIISFNLLQKNYFPEKLIRRGIENLTNALNEGGLLIIGNTVSFSVSMKTKGELVLMEKKGDF